MTASTTRRWPTTPIAQNAGAAHAEIRFAAGNRFGDVDVGATLADSDVETGIAIETLLQRRVIASKLELVLPFQLQRHLVERVGRPGSQQN